jgi:SAM-dependent methyltransferase
LKKIYSIEKNLKNILLYVTVILFSILCACNNTDKDRDNITLIAKIQEDIAKADKSPEEYYRNTYKPVEPRYWSKIASWMVEDSINRSYIVKKPATSILDLGCGYGTLLAFSANIYGAEGTCMDVIPYLQPVIMKKYNLLFIKSDIEKNPIPFEEKQFDVIIMTEVLEHLNFNPVPTLKKICKSLKNGGAFFMSTPDADGGWGRTTKYYSSVDEIPSVNQKAKWIDDHIWHYNSKELESVLYKAGFKIYRIDHSEGLQGKHFNVWAIKRSELIKKQATP